MKFNILSQYNLKLTISDSVNEKIISIQNMLDLRGNCWFEGISHLIVYEENLPEGFFDLKNGIAGEILQKFSTYNMNLGIVGNFSKYQSKSLQDFIFESNKAGRIIFTGSIEKAIGKWHN